MDHAPRVPPSDTAAPRRDIGRMLRLGVNAGLALGWLIMLLYAWSAFSTVPSPERLQETRMTQIPTHSTAGMLLLRSGAELAVVLALLWPSRRLYLTRITLAVAGLVVWFLATTPLTVTSMAWVHRRWLAAMAVALTGVLIVALAGRMVRGRSLSASEQVQHERHDVEL